MRVELLFLKKHSCVAQTLTLSKKWERILFNVTSSASLVGTSTFSLIFSFYSSTMGIKTIKLFLTEKEQWKAKKKPKTYRLIEVSGFFSLFRIH